MQYDMRKLGQMTLEQLTEIAQTFDIKVGKNAVAQSVIYQILDAQADRHGAEVQARAEAREERRKGKRTRIQSTPQKVNTDNLKSNRVLATVGSKEETMGQIKEEQSKQPQPKPVISGVQPSLFGEKAAIGDGQLAIGDGQLEMGETKPAKKKKGRKEKTAPATLEKVVEEVVAPAEEVKAEEVTVAEAEKTAADATAIAEPEKKAKSKKRGRPKKTASTPITDAEETKVEEVVAEPTEELEAVKETETPKEVESTETEKKEQNPHTPSRKNECSYSTNHSTDS